MRGKTIKAVIMAVVCTFALAALAGCGASEETIDKTAAPGKTKSGSPVFSMTPVPTLKVSSTPTIKPSPSSTTRMNAGVGFVNEDSVNLREKALVSSKSLAKLATNTQVAVIKQDAGNGWSEVECDGKQGFIATKYVTMVGESDILDHTTMGTIVDDDINIRSDATTSSKSLGTLSKNTKVTVIVKEAGGGWSLVQYGSRLVYVASKYIKFD